MGLLTSLRKHDEAVRAAAVSASPARRLAAGVAGHRRLRRRDPRRQRAGDADGTPLLSTANLHRSRVPLSQAAIDYVPAREWAGRQGELADALGEDELEGGALEGSSPWSCRSGAPVQSDFNITTRTGSSSCR